MQVVEIGSGRECTGWIRKPMRSLFLDMSSTASVSTVRSGAETQILGKVG